jgi:NAD(P)-dependent dehydrogenase (short-subunit alcohol dehydrogenase family)
VGYAFGLNCVIDFAAAPATGQAAGVHLYDGVDLADEEFANSVMKRIVHDAGRLDGLINIAGGFHWEKLEGGSLDTWDSMY